MTHFSKKLKALRLQESMTQADLANKLNLTKSVVSAYETGTRMPSYEVLVSIAKIFKVSTDYLLGVNSKTTVDLSGLTDMEKEAVMTLIQTMKK